MSVGTAIRRCPHRSNCAGCHGHKSSCALGKGSPPGKVRRSDCEACVLARRPELQPIGWQAPAPPVAPPPPPEPTPAPAPAPAPKPRPPKAGPRACPFFAPDRSPVPWLRDFYRGAHCFLLCGGPSLRSLDLAPLVERRGFLVAAVNNSPAILEPGYLRPDFWTHVDDAKHFLDHLWRDPGVMKFTALHKVGATIREKRPGGAFRNLPIKTGECPNVWGYKRHATFDPGEFLTSPTWTWGTAKGHDGPLGSRDRDTRSVLLIALRLLYELGIRSVYLLGADFHMGRGPGNQYGFGQAKDDARACASNNRKFGVLDEWFSLLRPIFEASDYRVYNSTAGSRLNAFERLDYEEAVRRARGPCGATVDGSGWY